MLLTKNNSSKTALDTAMTSKFIVPVLFETVLTVVIDLIYYQFISGISNTALTAISMSNSVGNLIVPLFTILTMGGGVLVSREHGAGNRQGTRDAILQSSLYLGIFSVGLCILIIAISNPLMKLLMPTAEAGLLHEAQVYIRFLVGGLPFLLFQTLFTTICRGLGDGRSPFWAVTLSNVIRLGLAFLFINVLHWNAIGAGIALDTARFLAFIMLVYSLFVKHPEAQIHRSEWKTIRLQKDFLRRIANIGIPLTIESFLIQLGYVIANTLVVAMGTFESSVYNVIMTLNNFPSIAQSVCVAIALSAAGNLLGAKRYDDAKKSGVIIVRWGLLFSGSLSMILILFGPQIIGLYSSDPDVVRTAASYEWIMLIINLWAVELDPFAAQLKAGGETKYVMIITTISVWLIRLPLTWLLAIHFNMGAKGVFIANLFALAERGIGNMVRHQFSKKWLYRKL